MARFLSYKATEQMTCYQLSVTVIKNAIAEVSHKTQNAYYIYIYIYIYIYSLVTTCFGRNWLPAGSAEYQKHLEI
jgi:hypothetical protein